MRPDPYATLGIHPDSSKAEIQEMYEALRSSIEESPDSPSKTGALREIDEAYRIALENLDFLEPGTPRKQIVALRDIVQPVPTLEWANHQTTAADLETEHEEPEEDSPNSDDSNWGFLWPVGLLFLFLALMAFGVRWFAPAYRQMRAATSSPNPVVAPAEIAPTPTEPSQEKAIPAQTPEPDPALETTEESGNKSLK